MNHLGPEEQKLIVDKTIKKYEKIKNLFKLKRIKWSSQKQSN